MLIKSGIFALAALASFGVVDTLSDEPRHGRPVCGIFGMGALREPDGGGGGTVPAPAATPPAASPPAPAAAPAAPAAPAAKSKADLEAESKAARLAVLNDLGFKDEGEFKADKEKRQKEADAKLSEGERSQKALKEALDGRQELETKFETHKKESKVEIASLREQLRMTGVFDEAGIHGAKNRLLAGTLYDNAKQGEGEKFKESAFFEGLKKEYPFLYNGGSAAPAFSSSAPAAPAASAYGAAPANGKPRNADEMTPEQWAMFKRNGYRLPGIPDSS